MDRLASKLKEAPAPYGLPTPCLIYQGSPMPSGHRRMWHKDKPELAHRVAWEVVHGPIPTDQRTGRPFVIIHRCDNPACCNVDHMALGSSNENNQDCIAKGRHASQSATMNKLTRAVELSASGKTPDDIAERLSVSPDEVERLLAFHVEDASLYAAEQITLGHDAAEDMRRYRLTGDYEAVIAATGMQNEARHINQLDLLV